MDGVEPEQHSRIRDLQGLGVKGLGFSHLFLPGFLGLSLLDLTSSEVANKERYIKSRETSATLHKSSDVNITKPVAEHTLHAIWTSHS